MQETEELLVITPATPEEFVKYYKLRWEVLRKPWKQPPGSEKDDKEQEAIHAMIKVSTGDVIAVGRLHFNNTVEGQIRYMAVHEKYRGMKLGEKILRHLEERAAEKGVSMLMLQARGEAVGFYKKLGYIEVEKSFKLYNSIQHFRMQKLLKA